MVQAEIVERHIGCGFVERLFIGWEFGGFWSGFVESVVGFGVVETGPGRVYYLATLGFICSFFVFCFSLIFSSLLLPAG